MSLLKHLTYLYLGPLSDRQNDKINKSALPYRPNFKLGLVLGNRDWSICSAIRNKVLLIIMEWNWNTRHSSIQIPRLPLLLHLPVFLNIALSYSKLTNATIAVGWIILKKKGVSVKFYWITGIFMGFHWIGCWKYEGSSARMGERPFHRRSSTCAR